MWGGVGGVGGVGGLGGQGPGVGGAYCPLQEKVRVADPDRDQVHRGLLPPARRVNLAEGRSSTSSGNQEAFVPSRDSL